MHCFPSNPSFLKSPIRCLFKKAVFASSTLLVLLLIQCGSAGGIPSGEWPDPLDTRSSPLQKSVSRKPIPVYFQSGTAQLKPVAEYRLTGIIKGIKTYKRDWNSRLSPVDLVIVWGNLTRAAWDRFMTYRQHNRWYYYRYRSGFPGTESYIVTHSSNNHIIPASSNLRKALRRLQKNQAISLEGYLVKIDAMFRNRRYWWNTSLTRQDTGDGSCEVFYVEQMVIGGKIYR